MRAVSRLFLTASLLFLCAFSAFGQTDREKEQFLS